MKKRLNYVSLSVLWLVSIFSVLFSSFTKHNLTCKSYVSIGLLLVITALFMFKYKYSKVLYFVFLVFGVFNLLSFSYVDYYWSFGLTVSEINLPSIGIQPLSLFILLIFILTNKEIL